MSCLHHKPPRSFRLALGCVATLFVALVQLPRATAAPDLTSPEDVTAAADALQDVVDQTTKVVRAIEATKIRWLRGATRWLNDPENPLRRQLTTAVEIPFPLLHTRDRLSLVIINQQGRFLLAELPHGGSFATALTADEVDTYIEAGVGAQTIDTATRKHLITALRETKSRIKDPDRAVAAAIDRQHWGELPAGRAAAFPRLLQSIFAPEGPAARALEYLAQRGTDPVIRVNDDITIEQDRWGEPIIRLASLFQDYSSGDLHLLAKDTDVKPRTLIKAVGSLIAQAKQQGLGELRAINKTRTRLVESSQAAGWRKPPLAVPRAGRGPSAPKK